MLKYAHENGCPWNEGTCSKAAEGGHLEVLKYAHERVSVGRVDVLEGGERRRPGGAEVRARERVSVGRVDVLRGGERRPPGGAAVGA